MKIEKIEHDENTNIKYIIRIELTHEETVELIRKLKLKGGRLDRIMIK